MENNPVIIDLGSSRVKFGRAGQTKPAFISSSYYVVDSKSGKYKFSVDGSFSQMASNSKAKSYSLVNLTDKNEPIVTNMEAFSSILKETQPIIQNKNISVEGIKVPILIGERNRTTTANRKELVELLFETHQVPSVFFAKCSTLAAYGVGKTTGLVIDAGFSNIEVSCVHNGLVLPETIKYSSMGGRELSFQISQYLMSKSKYFTGSTLFNPQGESNVRKLRELYKCNELLKDFIQFNFTNYGRKRSRKNITNENYHLPDGSIINDIQIRRLSDDILSKLFDDRKSSLITIQELIVQSGQLAGSSDLKKQIFNSIICCGGLANKKNFSAKLNNELSYLKQGKYQGIIPDYNVVTHNIDLLIGKDFDLSSLAWTGGSIVGSLSSFSDFTVTREMYNEQGMIAFESRCY